MASSTNWTGTGWRVTIRKPGNDPIMINFSTLKDARAMYNEYTSTLGLASDFDTDVYLYKRLGRQSWGYNFELLDMSIAKDLL